MTYFSSLRVPMWLLNGAIALSFLTSHALADGAIAIGTSGNVEKFGYALGIAVNQISKAEARAEALRLCQNDETAGNSPGKSKCQVVKTFRGQCAAEVNDPAPGTSGWGWAIARDQRAAEKIALGECIKRSSAERRDACQVIRSACDSAP